MIATWLLLASLTGLVRDATGLVLPGATIELIAARSAEARKTVSDAGGAFSFRDVSDGDYRLVVTFPGFATAEQTVHIVNGGNISLDVVMAVAAMQASVSVEATAAPAAASATLQTNVSRRLMETLPSESVSAGLSSLITLATPGVAADSNGGFHPLGEHAETSFSIDNQPITDQQSRTFSNQLPPEAIQSMDVLTGVPPAEFGDKTSLIVKATTRSGLGATSPAGSLSLGYGSFATPSATLTLGVGAARIGNFITVDGLSSGRFLDTPEAEPLHAHGGVYDLFDRFDLHPSERTGLQLNVFAARAAFQAPNTYDQQAAGQDQRQHQTTIDLAPSLTRTFGSSAVLEVNAWLRHDDVAYDGSANPLDDQPAYLSQHRTLTNAGAKAALSYATGAHTFKAGLQQTTTWLDERFQTALTDATFNSPCVDADGTPSADTTLRDPAQCAARGLAANTGFLPGLLPYDLTRGGTRFDFQGSARIVQWAAYLQDAWHAGPWDLSAGLRFDRYAGLSEASGLQPRVGVAYRIGRTDTVLRALYGRLFLTPYNENLVLASSTGDGLLGSVGGAPLTPATRNQYEVGLQQRAWRGVDINAEYFWKRTDGAYDFDVVFNTPLAFPVQFRKSTHEGGLVRVSLPEMRGWRLYTTLSTTHALLYGPELGGLRFSADYAPVAQPDHAEPFQSNTHVEYRSQGALGFWAGLTWRYDSGLVAVAVPMYAAALRLTGDEQAAIGLYCGGVMATLDAPLRSCASSSFGATRVNIPAAGTEDDATNPPRIVPHQLFDVAVGLDRLTVARVPLRVRLSVVNLLDTVALYNFLSTFSGTHFVTPRTIQLQVAYRW